VVAVAVLCAGSGLGFEPTGTGEITTGVGDAEDLVVGVGPWVTEAVGRSGDNGVGAIAIRTGVGPAVTAGARLGAGSPRRPPASARIAPDATAQAAARATSERRCCTSDVASAAG